MTASSLFFPSCRTLAAFVLVALAGAAFAEAPAPRLANPASQNHVAKGGKLTAKFSCADGKSIDATFINAGSARVRLAFSDGRRLTLPRAMSADGGRYANKAETIVFWNRGNTAFVQEKGKTTYTDCSTRS